MILVPAIDLYGGKCVRLFKGDFNNMKSYSDDPVEMARLFEDQGCTHLHVVDLEGARSGSLKQSKTLESIASATNLIIDFGGGIKTTDHVHTVLNSGAHRVTAGSIAVTNEQLVFDWINNFGSDRIILGADARDRKIAINGWTGTADIEVTDFIDKYADRGIRKVICTDINLDGTLEGPSLELYGTLIEAYSGLEVYASGGVSNLEDIRHLKKIGLAGVIVGKAIYEGTLNLKKALELC